MYCLNCANPMEISSVQLSSGLEQEDRRKNKCRKILNRGEVYASIKYSFIFANVWRFFLVIRKNLLLFKLNSTKSGGDKWIYWHLTVEVHRQNTSCLTGRKKRLLPRGWWKELSSVIPSSYMRSRGESRIGWNRNAPTIRWQLTLS